jgi:anaerobic ribonucleoside-triphosphate reductase activating protein
MIAYVNRIAFPVTALGFGTRVAVWLQGCSIRCSGCIVPETWERNDDAALPFEALRSAIAGWSARADGLTISGGEPFDQPDVIAALATAWRREAAGDVLVYSGYPFARLRERFRPVLATIDAVISEPFVARAADGRAFIGSSNQRLSALTPLGRDRYGDLGVYARRIDVALRHDAVHLAGVPERGALRILRDDLSKAGFAAETTHDPV